MKIRRNIFGYDPDDVKMAEQSYMSRKKQLKHRYKQDLQFLQREQQKCMERIAKLKEQRERLSMSNAGKQDE